MWPRDCFAALAMTGWVLARWDSPPRKRRKRRGGIVDRPYMKLCGSTSTVPRTPPRAGGAVAIRARRKP
jgi:hypothetical protein